MDIEYGKRVANSWRSYGGNIVQCIQSNTSNNIKQENPSPDGIHGFWFKNALSYMTDWQPKLNSFPNGWLKERQPWFRKNLKNTNGTNCGGDLLLIDKPWSLPRATERIPQRDQRHKTTIYWWTHPLQE